MTIILKKKNNIKIQVEIYMSKKIYMLQAVVILKVNQMPVFLKIQ